MTTNSRILIIDDDPEIGEFVSCAAHDLNLNCAATTDATTLLNLVAPDTTLIFLDLMMPDVDGIEVLRMLGEKHCTASIVLISGIDKRVIEAAEKLAHTLGLSVVGHLQKPFRLAELEEVLRTHSVPDRPPPSAEIPPIEFSDIELQHALERDELVLHYQPQINIATGKVIGVEALVRWQHPERGLIFPDYFISRTESLGLMDQLCWITVDRGMAEVKQFAGPDGVVPRLSLNVSVYSLRDLKFPDIFLGFARQHGVPAENIAIEITETGLISEHSPALDILTRLRMRNFQLSIDDFGTGYSMMRQLQNVPATELKIDKVFVQNLRANDSDRVMVQKIIEIGHELNMQVVAEGVETQDQLNLLREKGCDGAQGYLISRPLPPEKMVSWLAAYQPLQVR
jgi:EAL domain-containing protein (putative c-di-GMP-specific phosphodiesterase class I)/ActR/RegA family two-component response regulator